MSVAEALSLEIKRVTAIKEEYIAMRGMPQIMVEPAIFMMTQSIEAGVKAAAEGDVVAMIRAVADLKEYSM